MPILSINYHSVLQRIRENELKYNRDADSVQLLAVSKTFPSEYIQQIYDLGQRAFGENYVDEALLKIQALNELDIQWHYIGPIQSNKTRKIAENFHWAQSLDRLKIAHRLNEQRPQNLPPLNVCLQINISGEKTKSGIQLDDAVLLAREIEDLPRLMLRGIMGIPAPVPDPAVQRKAFNELARIYRQLIDDGHPLDTLSMGMSADMEQAIAEGSTMVRIGAAIFGQREKKR
ncbi:MAG: YggS family pyridoxal phosphate-dependent enzyme [Gammaproteobacteria bacterium]|nr:MAG: YggS family pyridoxal phosphate-dependent enzyme [Gammaproteobacteria bacterium]